MLADYGIPLTREDKTNLLYAEFVDPQSGIAKVLSKEWKIQAMSHTSQSDNPYQHAFNTTAWRRVKSSWHLDGHCSATQPVDTRSVIFCTSPIQQMADIQGPSDLNKKSGSPDTTSQ
jgi:hypothetical protein